MVVVVESTVPMKVVVLDITFLVVVNRFVVVVFRFVVAGCVASPRVCCFGLCGLWLWL